MAWLRYGNNRRLLRMTHSPDDFSVRFGDAPAASIASHVEVRDSDTCRPVLRLHQESAADLRLASFLVRMPVHDEIDPWNLSRNTC